MLMMEWISGENELFIPVYIVLLGMEMLACNRALAIVVILWPIQCMDVCIGLYYL